MLVGAARILSEWRGEVTGRVRFMFQPGEEGFAGARVMIDEGVLDGVDRAFALHISPNQRIGTASCRAGALLAGDTSITCTITGRGGHATAPHRSPANNPAGQPEGRAGTSGSAAARSRSRSAGPKTARRAKKPSSS